jgi:hypothetical protein
LCEHQQSCDHQLERLEGTVDVLHQWRGLKRYTITQQSRVNVKPKVKGGHSKHMQTHQILESRRSRCENLRATSNKQSDNTHTVQNVHDQLIRHTCASTVWAYFAHAAIALAAPARRASTALAFAAFTSFRSRANDPGSRGDIGIADGGMGNTGLAGVAIPARNTH